jgi:hypothetical protein
VHEHFKLKNAIEQAIADGDVDKGELREIVSTLARAGHTKQTLDQVKVALGDGDMDDEDRELLNSLLPPEPKDDWQATLELLEADKPFFKTVFRYFTAHGSSTAESETLVKAQFSSFAKAIKVELPMPKIDQVRPYLGLAFHSAVGSSLIAQITPPGLRARERGPSADGEGEREPVQHRPRQLL